MTSDCNGIQVQELKVSTHVGGHVTRVTVGPGAGVGDSFCCAEAGMSIDQLLPRRWPQHFLLCNSSSGNSIVAWCKGGTVLRGFLYPDLFLSFRFIRNSHIGHNYLEELQFRLCVVW